jgi:hypothetical protein
LFAISDHAVARLDARLCFVDAKGILASRRPQPVADHLLHRQMHIVIIEAVAQPRLPRAIGVRRNEPGLAWIVVVEIFDDDAGFGDHAIFCLVAQHRKLADRPQLQERRALLGIAEIDHHGREHRIVFVQGDQRLPTERRQRMVVKRERHEKTPV